MSNSSIIRKAKTTIIKEFIKDKEIVAAIDSGDISPDNPEGLIGTYIFDYNQDPDTLKKSGTFLTIQVHIPENYHIYSDTYVRPTIEIWIISHERHMIVDNIPKVIVNRNDYISELIDNKVNGRYDIGIGKLILVSNIEGSLQHYYLYRRMIFRANDLNESLCKDGN